MKPIEDAIPHPATERMAQFNELADLRAKLAQAERERDEWKRNAACPCCLGDTFGRDPNTGKKWDKPCGECHGTGLAANAYEHIRVVAKQVGERDAARKLIRAFDAVVWIASSGQTGLADNFIRIQRETKRDYPHLFTTATGKEDGDA